MHGLRERSSAVLDDRCEHLLGGKRVICLTLLYRFLRRNARYGQDRTLGRLHARLVRRISALAQRKRQLAGTLSGGEQQMLAVGRALMGKPMMILMDEPSMGLSPLLVKEIFAIIKEVNKQGITILLVEQNAKMALAISDRAYVLETGNITLSGDAQELLNDARIKKAYLGQ